MVRFDKTSIVRDWQPSTLFKEPWQFILLGNLHVLISSSTRKLEYKYLYVVWVQIDWENEKQLKPPNDLLHDQIHKGLCSWSL